MILNRIQQKITSDNDLILWNHQVLSFIYTFKMEQTLLDLLMVKKKLIHSTLKASGYVVTLVFQTNY